MSLKNRYWFKSLGKAASTQEWWNFLLHSRVNIQTKIRITGSTGGATVQTLPLPNVPFQQLPNSDLCNSVLRPFFSQAALRHKTLHNGKKTRCCGSNALQWVSCCCFGGWVLQAPLWQEGIVAYSTAQLASARPEQVKPPESLVPICYLLPLEHHTETSHQYSFWAPHCWNRQLVMQGQHKTHQDFFPPQEVLQDGWFPPDTHFILHSSLFLHLRSWRKSIGTRKSWTH